MPIRARIALFGAGVVAVTVVVFSVLVYVLVERNLITQQDDSLTRQGQALAARLSSPRPFDFGRGFFPLEMAGGPDTLYEVINSSGTPIEGIGIINGAPPAIPASVLADASLGHGVLRTIEPVKGISLRVFATGWASPGASGYVVVGRRISAIAAQLSQLRLFLVLGALLSLVGALVLTWLLAGRALRPLENMAVTAEEIGRTQDLSRRLPQQVTRDEVGRLQTSFNLMLSQLEDAYGRLQNALVVQRRFVADASHELRTPLTTIRGNVGLLMQRPDVSAEDRGAAIKDIASESERMSRMVQDLLTLARADAGQHLDKAPLDLRTVVQDVCRQAQTIQGSRSLQFDDGQSATINGNPDALKQLVWILVDNALKHTDEGGHVRVRMVPENGAAALTVSDDGPGIPEADLERIFERFYQADQARSAQGTGLGLAIARWVAGEHGGRIRAVNNSDRGATFRVELPLLNPAARA